jgi:hypothetical protein
MQLSNQQVESTPQSGSEQDFVVELLQKAGLPLTRENYLGLAYPDGRARGSGREQSTPRNSSTVKRGQAPAMGAE